MNWISVKDQLPKEDKFYLCSQGGEHLILLEYKKGEFYLGLYKYKPVSFWMELPKAPGE